MTAQIQHANDGDDDADEEKCFPTNAFVRLATSQDIKNVYLCYDIARLPYECRLQILDFVGAKPLGLPDHFPVNPYEILGLPDGCHEWKNCSPPSDRTRKEIEAAYDTLRDVIRRIKYDAVFTTAHDGDVRNLRYASVAMVALKACPMFKPGPQSVLIILMTLIWLSFAFFVVDFRFVNSMELAHIAALHLLKRRSDGAPVASSKLREDLQEFLGGKFWGPDLSKDRTWRKLQDSLEADFLRVRTVRGDDGSGELSFVFRTSG
jgi:hypothetical protein